MYKNFFGFKERPFKLVPDPTYLFLSRSHEVALAHLNYAVIQGDGFVEITGEIGTGKTTLCRAFLETLDDNTKAAYIFNPKLNSIQLLKAINDEFGISSQADNTKDLIDTLNVFLIEEKSKGTHVILVIDEAQTLDNEVLEQVRLLSNLETTKDKLLQIVLVGQPELEERLDSRELRQLGQRITLCSQLIPLSYKEVVQYIQHRISIASRKPGVNFTRTAYKAIYQYSGGIPRLINIVCDRALMTAYVLEQEKITGDITNAAIKELAGRGDIKHYSFQNRKRAVAFLSTLCLAVLILFFYRSGLLSLNKPSGSSKNKNQGSMPPKQFKTDHPASVQETSPAPIIRPPGSKHQESNATPVEENIFEVEKADVLGPIKPADPPSVEAMKPVPHIELIDKKMDIPITEPKRDLEIFLGNMSHFSSRHMALQIAMDLWDAESEIRPSHHFIENDDVFFHQAAKENNLLIRRIYCNFKTLKKLNLPAILSFSLPKASGPIYLSLTKINKDTITISGGEDGDKIEIQPDDLKPYWSGIVYIPWKNFLSLKGTIPLNATEESVIMLKRLMHDIGFSEIEINPFYDYRTRMAVEKIQRKYEIQVDGIVGSTTKIAINNEKNFDQMPHITD